MSKRVFLHVATPKSGTSYLQALLWHNVDALRHHNLLLPATFDTHYVAAKAVTGRTRMRETGVDPATAWSTLASASHEWHGDVLISHELLAGATVDQARRALGQLQPAELHLIITARALHRQIPAAWQQGVRGGLRLTLETFANQVRNRTRRGLWFWAVQDVPAIAERWSQGVVTPNRVHIVTVPGEATEPTNLWRRYASVLGLDPEMYDVNVPRTNVSLGRTETEMLRRLHRVCDDRFPDAKSSPWTRGLLVDEVLSERRGDPIWLPDETESWLSPRIDTMATAIAGRGYAVVGDLADLSWQSAPPGVETGSTVTNDQMAEVVAWTVQQLTGHLRRLAPDPPILATSPGGVTKILDLLDRIRTAAARQR